MKNINSDKRCLGCHIELEDKYYFCSITCACICGYMHVRNDGEHRDMKELKDKKIRDKFLNNHPRRERPTNKYYEDMN